VRAPVANLRVAAESLAAYPEMEVARRAQFVDIVAAESRVLTERLNAALSDYADALKSSLTLEDMRVVDLLVVVQRRVTDAVALPARIDSADEDLWCARRQLRLRAGRGFPRRPAPRGLRDTRGKLPRGRERQFRRARPVWTGAIVGSDALALWETEPMRIGADETPLTLKDVLERHGGELWSQPTNRARRPGSAPPAVGRTGRSRDCAREDGRQPPGILRLRPLWTHRDTGALAERRLGELAYTVFDTETTGLEPSRGRDHLDRRGCGSSMGDC